MSDLIEYISEVNERFKNKIIHALLEDHGYLLDHGITENELQEKNNIPDLIKSKIFSSTNKLSIDAVLKYVISEHLYDDDELPLISHYCSADSYTSSSALYVFKFMELYFCYARVDGDFDASIITEEPDSFCYDIASSFMDNYEMEKENLNDEWFKDSNPCNEITMNFKFNKQ